MKKKARIITDNDSLRAQYQDLSANDLIVGRIRLHPSEEHLLLDLVDRGVRVFPSAVSQLASRSKTFQVLLFSEFMLPHTFAVHDQHTLLSAMNHMGKHGVKKVVTKLDRKNAGTGIHQWNSVEDVYNQASLGVLGFPFVLQPYLAESHDIRIIILGEYMEAYRRHNPHNFRNNLHYGGESENCTPTSAQRDLCKEIMERGKFPFAHIDLMVSDSGNSYLAEINLRGGIKGARISPAEYKAKVDAIHQKVQAF